MKKAFLIGFGALFIGLGLLMLVVIVRDGGGDGGSGQAALLPLGLIGAGAMSISRARRPPKTW
ncbi:MAG: hypothetical protein AB7Q23_10945 [Hyphomonadaceae bacterium]